MSTRRGFTLVELMIGLILLLAVGAVTYRLLVTTQRVSRSQSQHIGMQDNVRSGALVIASELREVGYDEITAAGLASVVTHLPGFLPGAGVNTDLIAIGPDSITYRAMRGVGFACNLIAGTSDVIVYNAPVSPLRWRGIRALTTTDSLMLYVENDATTASDDLWLRVGITAAPVAQNCPDGTAGIRYRIGIPASYGVGVGTLFNLGTAMRLGAPVRAFEVMQMRSYVSGGKAWLGMRARPAAGTTLEPVLGPLSNNATGLALTYKDVNDNATTVPNNVRSIQVGLRSVSDELVRTTGKTPRVDSLTLTTRVALRNALRP